MPEGTFSNRLWAPFAYAKLLPTRSSSSRPPEGVASPFSRTSPSFQRAEAASVSLDSVFETRQHHSLLHLVQTLSVYRPKISADLSDFFSTLITHARLRVRRRGSWPSIHEGTSGSRPLTSSHTQSSSFEFPTPSLRLYRHARPPARLLVYSRSRIPPSLDLSTLFYKVQQLLRPAGTASSTCMPSIDSGPPAAHLDQRRLCPYVCSRMNSVQRRLLTTERVRSSRH